MFGWVFGIDRLWANGSGPAGRNCGLRPGRVTGIVRSADGSTVEVVEVAGGVNRDECRRIAMGPWSLMAAGWIVLPPCKVRASSTIPARTLTLRDGDAACTLANGIRDRAAVVASGMEARRPAKRGFSAADSPDPEGDAAKDSPPISTAATTRPRRSIE